MKLLLLTLCTCLFLLSAFPQKKTTVTIHFSNNMQTNRVKIFFDNGITSKEIKPSFVHNQCSFSDSFYSHYGFIEISYPLKGNEHIRPAFKFFLDERPATIDFTIPDTISGFPEARTTNITLLNATPTARMLDSAFITIDNTYFASVEKIMADTTVTDSALNLINKKLSERMHRKLDLLSKHGNNYYALWLFKLQLVPGAAYNFDDRLITVFNTAFPDSLRNTFDGKQIAERLQQRAFVKHQSKAPYFSTKDVRGNVVDMNQLKGKYVLLDFWSTHCASCIERIPHLKKLREKYPKEKLEIISICTNNDSIGFARISKKQGITWTSIIGNPDLGDLYSIGPIPAIYFINPQGNSVFNYMEEAEDKIEQILTAASK